MISKELSLNSMNCQKGGPMQPVNRLENWKAFNRHMEQYLQDRVAGKYQGIETEEERVPDLMWFTDRKTCIWNILKYALRVWRGHGKSHDLEKMAHYAEMAWSMDQIEQAKQIVNLHEPAMKNGEPAMNLHEPAMKNGEPAMGLHAGSMKNGEPAMGLHAGSMKNGEPAMGLHEPAEGKPRVRLNNLEKTNPKYAHLAPPYVPLREQGDSK
jgi:hypothetical protein